MRSILKSRRKSDSSIPELNPPPDFTIRKPPSRLNKVASSTKLSLSPTPHQNPVHMTPPQNVVPGQQSSVSSPKKLLTPIKKMFGHHSKQANLSLAGDTLNNVLNGDFEPPKGRKEYKRDFSSATNLAELRDSMQEKPLHCTDSISPVSISSTDTRISSKPTSQHAPLHQASSHPKLVIEEPPAPRSKHVYTSKPGNHEITTPKAKDYFSSDSSLAEDEDFSDCSSEFSFEKGVRGGRNTSVKYYKTKTETAPNSAIAENYLNMDDMGFEDGAMSDYDFENNGMSDDDAYGEEFDEDNPESSNRYNDFLSEGEAPNAQDFEEEIFDEMTSEVDPIYPQDTISINVESTSDAINPNSNILDVSSSAITQHALINKESQEYFETGAKSPGYDDDFIDSYLDRDKSLSESDLATPVHEPVAINASLSHDADSDFSSSYSGEFNKDNNQAASSPESDAHSGIHEPNMGLGIDFGPADEEQEKEKIEKVNNRLSILNMMDTLLRIDAETSEEKAPSFSTHSIDSAVIVTSESNNVTGVEMEKSKTEIGEPSTKLSSLKKQEDPVRKKEIRKSLIDMMNTLSRLDNDLEKETEESAVKVTKKDVRKSIADMMSTLHLLESHPEITNEDEQPNTKEDRKFKGSELNQIPETTKSKKRYSWFSTEGNSERSENNSSIGFERNPLEGHALHLTQDILDEINSLPEDYDFSESLVTDHDDSRGFLRSNSYKNRPQKVVHDYNVQNNKLQLSNRTVTFYKTSSLDPSDYLRTPKSRSPSRIGSIRSTPSLHSIDDEEFHESDEDRKEDDSKDALSPLRIRANLTGDASVSPQKISSLEPISETHTPPIS